MKLLTVKTTIEAPMATVWNRWTSPEHVMNWNFASPDWHCPKASNELVEGGSFHYIMAARDGSFEFDFWGTFKNIELHKNLEIELGDGRKMMVAFESDGNTTTVTEKFEPETQNPEEMQLMGWQMILDNFKQYVQQQQA